MNNMAIQINENDSYITIIKKRLFIWKRSFENSIGLDLNYSAISDIMQEYYNIDISPQKLSAIFDPQSKREIKLQDIFALSQILNIPIWDICEYPYAPSNSIDLYKLVGKRNSKKRAVNQLNNDFYNGKYFCYYFKPKYYFDHIKPIEESSIEEAELMIDIKEGHTIVTLKELKSNTKFDGTPMTSFTLTGNLYHFENTDMAYGFISDETGRRAMALMFKYLNLSADIRYYIPIGMLTFSLNQTHEPLFQKMAVFRVRQNLHDEKNIELLRGILTLNTGTLIIDEDTLNDLINNKSELSNLVSPDNALKKCYAFSESSIKGNSAFISISDENERMKLLLQLRSKSLNSAHELISEPDIFADFIKAFQ